jgi:hypothetical protein
LGSRLPAYGPLNCVVDSQRVEAWLRTLSTAPGSEAELALALMLGARRVHDRYRDISDEVRELVLARLESLRAAPHWIELVRAGGALQGEEANQVWGEALPLGLTLQG